MNLPQKKVNLQCLKLLLADGTLNWLVHYTKHNDDILPLRLGEELGEDTNVVEHTLSICESHGPSEEVNLTPLARMIVALRK